MMMLKSSLPTLAMSASDAYWRGWAEAVDWMQWGRTPEESASRLEAAANSRDGSMRVGNDPQAANDWYQGYKDAFTQYERRNVQNA